LTGSSALLAVAVVVVLVLLVRGGRRDRSRVAPVERTSAVRVAA
jgi:hypothetical protein